MLFRSNQQIKYFKIPLPREEGTFPTGEMAPRVTWIIALCVETHVETGDEKWGEGIGELHDADGGN